MHSKYGDVVRIGPNDLSYVNEAVVRDVLGHRQGHEEFAKSPMSIPPSPNGVHGLLGSNRADHARFRRNFSHAFSEKGLREQEP